MPMQDSLPAGWPTFAERDLNPLGRDMKTTKALGIIVPPALLVRADEVIE